MLWDTFEASKVVRFYESLCIIALEIEVFNFF